MASEHELVAKITATSQRLAQAVGEAQWWYQERKSELEAAFEADRARAAEQYDVSVHECTKLTTSLENSLGFRAAPWASPMWSDWKPPPASGGPYSMRLGQLTEEGQWGPLAVPACPAFVEGAPLLIEADKGSKSEAARAVRGLLLRILATIPPGRLRFAFFDPIGLGDNVAGLMQLVDYDEMLVTGKAWTEPQQVEQRLADITEHMENVIQKYLRHQYASIEEFNEQAGEVAEPYRVLAVFDFPSNFNESAARRLVSIAANGPRCGVFTLVVADPSQKMPHGFDFAELERVSTVIAWKDGRWVWQDEDFEGCLLEMDAPPGKDLSDRIIQAVGEGAKQSARVEVPFHRVAPSRDKWWKANALPGLRIPLGPSGARAIQHLDLGKGTAQHALVAGQTGSGKSTLLHVLIANGTLMYSPEELELYLVDFKKGVEFKTYATHALPHARVVAIESEREFGLSVLQGLDAELKRRGEQYRAAGVDGLADYRQRTGQQQPRILLMVDEFQEFFTEDDATARESGAILDRLVRQGRAFGIHVLLGSQTLAGAYSLARSTMDQMAVRIALQCTEADSRIILADDNPVARLLSRPGEAIYNADNGRVEGNNRFQVVWLSDDERERHLDQLAQLAEERGYHRPEPQIVFEGNAPADVRKNRYLLEALQTPALTAPRVAKAWLGEPVAMRDPVAALFRRQSGSNFLVVGQDHEAALGMATISLVGLAAQYPVDGAHFYVLDFSAGDAADERNVFVELKQHTPHRVTVGRRRELPGVIGHLEVEVQRRLATDDGNRSVPSHYLFIHGLQRARDLQADDALRFGSLGDESGASLAQQFATVLREGPDVGIHTLVWCDTVTNLHRILDRRALREFCLRVAFQMSAEDSSHLLETPAASRLGPYRALFYSEDEGRLEKFRPYSVPPREWFADRNSG